MEAFLILLIDSRGGFSIPATGLALLPISSKALACLRLYNVELICLCAIKFIVESHEPPSEEEEYIQYLSSSYCLITED